MNFGTRLSSTSQTIRISPIFLASDPIQGPTLHLAAVSSQPAPLCGSCRSSLIGHNCDTPEECVRYFVEPLSNEVCLMFSGAFRQAVHFWEESHHDAALVSVPRQGVWCPRLMTCNVGLEHFAKVGCARSPCRKELCCPLWLLNIWGKYAEPI